LREEGCGFAMGWEFSICLPPNYFTSKTLA
jgi:hypothetical protein